MQLITGTVVYTIATVILALLTVLVFRAMHAAGGWSGLIRGHVVYTIAVAIMAALTVLVILVLHAATS
jgi:hypothetical protein